MITKIEITETINTMGDTSEEDARKFCAYLKQELEGEYPDAVIAVELNNKISSTIINVATDDVDEDGYPAYMDADEEIQEFINEVWGKMEWCA